VHYGEILTAIIFLIDLAYPEMLLQFVSAKIPWVNDWGVTRLTSIQLQNVPSFGDNWGTLTCPCSGCFYFEMFGREEVWLLLLLLLLPLLLLQQLLLLLMLPYLFLMLLPLNLSKLGEAL
jgi:hypothetical protein